MQRSTALILVLLAVFLCTCPGLAICLTGGLVVIGNSSDPTLGEPFLALAGWFAIISGLGIAVVPVIIAVVALRLPGPKQAPLSQADLEEDLPPPI